MRVTPSIFVPGRRLTKRCRNHVSLDSGFLRAEVDSDRAEGGGAACLRRVGKDIRLPRNLKIDETDPFDLSLQLCFQQSPGDSASPEVDLSLCSLRNRFRDQDVSHLQSAAGAEYTGHFAKR